MASDYKQICLDNIRRRGEEFDDIGRLISEQLYPDKSHFIYELLQNAEDALGRRFKLNPSDRSFRKVRFILFHDRLEFRHFGALFDKEDVKGISDVLKGTKKEDIIQIGKFGIGFKSVYSFTSSPEIHSGDEHFIIRRYIRPEAQLSIPSIEINETVFVFPFNHQEFNEKEAFELIFNKLQGLGPRVLLFLRWIDEIEWFVEPFGEKGQYIKEAVKLENYNDVRQITVIGQINGRVEDEDWLVFERYVKIPDSVNDLNNGIPVEIGFLLESNEKDKNERIIKVKNSPLVVFFPTEKETRFGFLMQGPYKTTPGRDNILTDDIWNKLLVQETAKLLTFTVLPHLKQMGLLTVSLIEALPIRILDFNSDSMFFPIYTAVKSALTNGEYIPADDKTFVSAKNTKIARSADLRNLLTAEQLQLLYKETQLVKWASAEISQDRTPDLRSYLMEQLGIEEVRPEKFVDLLTDHFLENQPDKWIIDFYTFLGTDRTDLFWKRSDAVLRKIKIIRLEDNSHVIPFKSDGTPNAYLPSTITSNFPTIKKNIFENEAASDFLKRLGIIEPDSFAEIIEFILPKYDKDSIVLSTLENIDDLKKIKRLLEEPFPVSSSSSLGKVKILLSKLAFHDEETFTRFEPKIIIPVLFKNVLLPKIRFLRASNGLNDDYKSPSYVYKSTPDLRCYFEDNSEAWFIVDGYPDELKSLFQDLGVEETPRITKTKPDNNGYVIISESHSSHERGLEGFDPDIEVDGLEKALANPTIQKSKFIWNKIALEHWSCIRGDVEKSSKKTFENSKKENKYSKFGDILINTEWLPNPNGGFSKSQKLTLDDLPIGFEKNTPQTKSLSYALGMKQPERDEALERVTGGDQNLKKIIEGYWNASDDERNKMLQTIPREILPQPVPSFKKGLESLGRPQRGIFDHGDKERYLVSNSDRYQEKLNERVEARVDEHKNSPPAITFSLVKDHPSNADARKFLYEHYHGYCQVTGTTFPKATPSRDGVAENYFEACSLLSYEYADYLNDAGNMLCVSADTMAKFKNASVVFIEDIGEAIEKFKLNGSSAESVSVKIRLAGEECTITWSQRHFMRLVALYERA